MDDLDAHARDLIDANRYLALGTADGDGVPWVSPVFFATADYRDLYWVSDESARHSRNVACRPQVSAVIYDSQVPAYHGRAVYLAATAAELTGADLDRGLEIFPGAASRGARGLELDDVVAPSTYRMYRATVTEAYVLCPREAGTPCRPHAVAADHRAEVTPWRVPR